MSSDSTNEVSQENGQQAERSAGSGLFGVVNAVYHALFRDGALGRAGTQGLDELCQAIRGFPDSIHAAERDAVPWIPNDGQSVPAVGVWAEQDRETPSASPTSVYGSARAAESTVHGPVQPAVGVWADANRQDSAQSMQFAENPKNWQERIMEERQNSSSGNDQNELEKARILPIEQKEQREREDQSRGR